MTDLLSIAVRAARKSADHIRAPYLVEWSTDEVGYLDIRVTALRIHETVPGLDTAEECTPEYHVPEELVFVPATAVGFLHCMCGADPTRVMFENERDARRYAGTVMRFSVMGAPSEPTEFYVRARDGKRAVCPECGGAVVWDCGLWHCDGGGHGAFDRADWEEPEEGTYAAQVYVDDEGDFELEDGAAPKPCPLATDLDWTDDAYNTLGDGPQFDATGGIVSQSFLDEYGI